jgi:hypothetical protein
MPTGWGPDLVRWLVWQHGALPFLGCHAAPPPSSGYKSKPNVEKKRYRESDAWDQGTETVSMGKGQDVSDVWPLKWYFLP